MKNASALPTEENNYIGDTDFAQHTLAKVISNTPLISLVLNEQGSVVYANDLFLDFVNAPSLDSVSGIRIGNISSCIYSEKTGLCGTSQDCQRCGLRMTIDRASSGGSSSGEALFIRRTLGTIRPQSLEVTAYKITLQEKNYVVVHLARSGERVMREAVERLFLHDALNSISGIQGLSTTLIQSADPEQRKLLNIIESYSKALAEEIKFYRNLRDAEGGDLSAEYVPVSTQTVMEHVANLNTHLAECRGKQVVFDMETCDVTFKTDSRLLKRVLGNMVKNAIEATPQNGFVLFKCTNDENSVIFSVYNDGSIPQDIRSNLFRGFVSSKGGGRGLGLYGIKLFTEQYLHGAVSFSSSPEAGTWFNICLPLDAPKNKTGPAT